MTEVAPGRSQKEIDDEFRRHADIVYSATRQKLKDLQYVPIRALGALMKTDSGRRAFHRCLGSLRILPLLCHHDDEVSKAASHLFAKATASSRGDLRRDPLPRRRQAVGPHGGGRH